MKISYNWLKQYVDFTLTPTDLGEVLTGVGLEVEDVVPFETIQGGLEGVVIGEVKECSKHPDADKLSVTKIDVGTGELLQIVCGAPNVAAGQKVVVALVGSTLYPAGSTDKLAIKKAKIRGVESFGMICAEDELGLNDNHAGIMVLPADTIVGTKAADYFKVEKDYVLEIGLTPNRSDANSHIGTARDIVAALNVAYKSKVSLTKPDLSKYQSSSTKNDISVEVRDADACPRYSGVVIGNLKVGESPDWLKNKLKAIGVRSINNVVDVTNYVLHEYGQPLHAFDASKIRSNKVVVKKLAEGTVFKTLDEKDIKLSSTDLMICDAEGGMCIAGVFGGADSGVTNNTTTIFLESAYFAPSGIRKTSTRLGLRTDAATHFEKGCDPNITVDALKRAAILLREIAGGEVQGEIIDIYPKPIKGEELTVSYDRILKLAGFTIEKPTVISILNYLEIEVKEDGDLLHLTIPTFKTEVKREADIVEELLRIYGYNGFTLPTAVKSSLQFSPAVNVQKLENTIADMLSGAGLNEVWTNSVTQSKFEQSEILKAQQVKLLNSQTYDLDSLRTSLLYSGLEVIAHNQNRKNADLRFYEFGKTYHLIEGKYSEQRHLGIWMTGKTIEDNWLAKGEKYSFYHLKTTVNNILRRLGYTGLQLSNIEELPFTYGLEIKNEDVLIARLGSIDRKVLKTFDVKSEVLYADLNWDYLLDRSQFAKTSFSELAKFPAVRRDLAMVVNEDLKFESIEKIAYAEAKKLLQEVSLFDVYKGDKIEKGKKSYAVSFTLQHPDKTLTDEEVEKVMGRLMNKYEGELGAIIRKG